MIIGQVLTVLVHSGNFLFKHILKNVDNRIKNMF